MNPDFDYALIKPKNLDYAWVEVLPWLAKSIGDPNDPAVQEELKFIREGVAREILQLWTIQDRKKQKLICVIVSEPRVELGRKTLVLRWGAGMDMVSWFPDLAIIENWARHQGVDRISFWGREGWGRLLKPYGYRHEFSVFSLNLGVQH